MENTCIFFKPSTSEPHNPTSLSSDVNSFPLDLRGFVGGFQGSLLSLLSSPGAFSWVLCTFPPHGSFAGIQTIQEGQFHCCPSVQVQIKRTDRRNLFQSISWRGAPKRPSGDRGISEAEREEQRARGKVRSLFRFLMQCMFLH